MPDINENRKHTAQLDGVKTKSDRESLKKRIQRHYNVTSDEFLHVWYATLHTAHALFPVTWLIPRSRGEHIHHNYFKSPTDTADEAQLNQVIGLAESSEVSIGTRVLDVGCGVSGTARYLARERGCKVTAITNSERQVEIARELVAAEAAKGSLPPSSPPPSTPGSPGFIQYPDTGGSALRVLELDIYQMGERLGGDQGEKFDCFWSSEVIFHLHERQRFFDSSFALLGPGGCLVIADIFRTAADPTSSSRGIQKELASILRNVTKIWQVNFLRALS